MKMINELFERLRNNEINAVTIINHRAKYVAYRSGGRVTIDASFFSDGTASTSLSFDSARGVFRDVKRLHPDSVVEYVG